MVHADQVFRLELERPIAPQDSLRGDGHVIGPELDLSLSIWLDAARTPVRVEIRDGDDRVTAQMITD